MNAQTLHESEARPARVTCAQQATHRDLHIAHPGLRSTRELHIARPGLCSTHRDLHTTGRGPYTAPRGLHATRCGLYLFLFLLVSCAPGTSDDSDRAVPGPGGADTPAVDIESGDEASEQPASERSLLDAAREVARALAARDFAALADRVDPDQGVLFAPYTYVEPDVHVTLSAGALRAVARGEVLERRWGSFDGSGDAIELSFRDYVDRFVYDRPYLEQGEMAVEERQGSGNSLDNAGEVWPNARTVEWHTPGSDPRYGGMDWRSLRLVFEERVGRWWLVGIVHDEWTI